MIYQLITATAACVAIRFFVLSNGEYLLCCFVAGLVIGAIGEALK